MQLSKYHYWVLDHVFNTVEPLCDLTIFLKEGESILGDNMPPVRAGVPLLDLTVSELAEIVLSLFEMGYISVIDETEKSYLKVDFVPSFGEILDSLSLSGVGDLNPYGLTDLGGKIWEEYSKPNWDHYVSQGSHFIDDETYYLQIRCTSKEILERMLIAHQVVPSDKVESGFMMHEGQPIPGTITWETLAQWDVSYWKTLNYGFLLQFKLAHYPETPYIENKVMTDEELANYFFPQYLQENWCQKYFDIANQSR